MHLLTARTRQLKITIRQFNPHMGKSGADTNLPNEKINYKFRINGEGYKD